MTTKTFDVASADAVSLSVYDSVSEVLKSNDLDLIAAALAGLDRLKREVSEMHDAARDRMVQLMGDAPEHQAAGFHFEKKLGSTRKAWDHNSLSSVVAKRLMSMSVDMDTGEITKSPEEMIKEAFNFAGVSYWRVKELQKIGINADSYCEVVEGKSSIIVRKTDKEQ